MVGHDLVNTFIMTWQATSYIPQRATDRTGPRDFPEMEVTSSLIELFTFFFTHREKTYVQCNELRTELFTNLQKA